MIWNEKRENAYCEITPALLALKEQWEKKNYIDPRLYKEYNVKRGLRDEDGRGVLTGLTRVGEIQSYQVTSGPDGEHIIPDEGMLYYRGIDCREIVKGSAERGRFAFEEAAYLLLFGELPTADQLQDFCVQLASYRTLPTNFFRDVIMKAPPKDLMNTMQRAILTLFCYDDKPNDVGLENVLRQCLQLTANMPVLAIYAYQAWRYSQGESLFIHVPKPELSTAENFLRMLREDRSYTELEARVLDVALVLHADHGGGNNSTFTNHVVTSSGTDTYSAIAASMASLKGPRHGGANSKVMDMMDDIKTHVRDWGSEGEITQYLTKLLDKEAFDRSGLIYGLGHAVYTRSDPRCEVFRDYVHRLAGEKGLEQELALYSNVERIGKQLLMERRHKDAISTNIDFYSGFVYEMLGLPGELYTPLFAVARISGWSAHRMEELSSGGKLIRPRYECVEEVRSYIPMENR
ncbi:citrate/2-methylcitrate synthase [Dysosmobacter sp. NSJ-60]|uniref:Citrate synthase n=1 Tax=Pusillibacter faecalis TaxID=2714358 RepID=A0A810Q8P8_9FIRM|nr:citrate/2-methylcitrate synthase [Pusillibacter faecalis]MBC5747237.1 citrate/2-methylcitrate synthase [Dysosmobacter hominis]MBS5658213.1 citrate/2-methylcitrate synthase [Oscillibacter sp.]MCQ5027152.1 citrate/2-methylcitrate synthase [Oscillibacter valericigenes]BCK84639.1 citrate synthase [Pusillibacter faecalis]